MEQETFPSTPLRIQAPLLLFFVFQWVASCSSPLPVSSDADGADAPIRRDGTSGADILGTGPGVLPRVDSGSGDTVRDSSVEVATAGVAECGAVCAKHPAWSPGALCEDYQSGEPVAYFCVEPLSQDSCEASCSRAVAASVTPQCRSAWLPYLSCLESAKSYEDTVIGSDFRCDPSVGALLSACWVVPALDSAVALWDAKKPSAFGFTLSRSIEVPPTSRTVWKITVANGVVKQAPPAPIAPTVDGIFAEVRTALGRPGGRVFFVYDRILGYPAIVTFFGDRTTPGFLPPSVLARYSLDSFVVR